MDCPFKAACKHFPQPKNRGHWDLPSGCGLCSGIIYGECPVGCPRLRPMIVKSCEECPDCDTCRIQQYMAHGCSVDLNGEFRAREKANPCITCELACDIEIDGLCKKAQKWLDGR